MNQLPNLTLKRFSVPLIITLIVTIIPIFGSTLHNWLRFDRDAILAGEIWRLISGHLTHLGWSHLAMNVAGLALIWALFGQRLENKAWWAVVVAGTLGTSAALLIFNDELRWYVGFSGVLHTLFVTGVLLELDKRQWDGIVLLCFVVLKLAWEQISGPLPGSESTAGGKVIVDAHLYGALSGAFCWAALTYRKKSIEKKTA
jgi:rhomboid family GlyGly-CTERM serine protease